MVGKIKPPQISRVKDAGFEVPLRSVGTRGKYVVRSKKKRKAQPFCFFLFLSEFHHWERNNSLEVI